MHHVIAALAPLVFAAAAIAQSPAPAAGQVGEADLRRHIDILASDDYEGRKPGTAGETKTLRYLSSQFAALGLVGGAGEGAWYQPVPLVQRTPHGQRALWTDAGATLTLSADELVLIGKDPVERVADAPVWFVGAGAALPSDGIAGAVMLVQRDTSGGQGSYAERVAALRAASAAAILAVLPDAIPWQTARASLGQGLGLASIAIPDIGGGMPLATARRLAGSVELGATAVRLPVRATLDVSTIVNSFDSYNLIARLPGTGTSGEAVLVLGHWDHLGICRPEGAPDRICNGAVDNASGMAVMIEAARHLARGKRPTRDILFMATTAEESGLLGAEHYAATKPTGVVAAVNIDTVAIAGRGEPVAIVGRGTTALDPIVDATARALGRRVDADLEANAFVQRQDGWELTKAGIPTVMAGGSFSNMAKLGAFLAGPYHKPEDDLARPIELGGAAEDTDFTVALVRRLADPVQYRPSAR